MRHLGDITKISGYTAPIVDCVIGGSPCQDLSMAGKREGLNGERSGLYMEQIRIVKEMRAKDEQDGRSGVNIRPRYMVWENVPGAFSSNKAEDFQIVLEELAKVKDKDAVIPRPEDGKWRTSGCIMGDGWSIAWRVLDTQFWGLTHYLDDGNILFLGTPQRRKRIALVADFGGQSAPEILFVRKSVSGDTDEGKQKGKATSSDASGSIGTDDRSRDGINCLTPWDYQTRRCYGIDGSAPSLCAGAETSGQNQQAFCIPVGGDRGRGLDAIAYTLKIRSGCEGGGKGALVQKEKSATLSTLQDQVLFQPVYSVDQGGGKSGCNVMKEKAPTLTCTHGGEPAVCYSVENHPNDSRVGINEDGIVQALTGRMGTGGGNVPMVLALDRASYNQGKNAQFDFEISDKSINSPLVAKGPGTVCYEEKPVICLQGAGATSQNSQGMGWNEGNSYTLNTTDVHGVVYSENQGGELVAFCEKPKTRYIVRRLTPLECERLQGYPDGWTDIGEWTDSKGKKKQTSDAARYKALGNSIALPPWKWVLKRICACYERDATMASLFDGIGGFPYLWEQLNGKGTCLWASEIEEFPIAVTKVRIGDT